MPHSPRLRHQVLALGLVALATAAQAQQNGKLQLHFIEVGQGDAAILISPRGETVLFDNGVPGSCEKVITYLSGIGVGQVDYHVASHYHADHIGCSRRVFAAHPIRKAAYDRGDKYDKKTFYDYEAAVGAKRRTATPGSSIRLDAGTPNPVTINFLVANGLAANGSQAPTKTENDFSVVAVVRFGGFDAVMGGDLSGRQTSSYRDVESVVAAAIGQVELYKVNHHGSTFSSNQNWLAAIKPLVGIISAGVGNGHGHPQPDALARLHAANVRTYWTTTGAGEVAPASGRDVVGGNIVVEVPPNSTSFTVTYALTTDSYTNIGASPGGAVVPRYAWSIKAKVYHLADCIYVNNISNANLKRADQPPTDKQLHEDCPRHGSGQ